MRSEAVQNKINDDARQLKMVMRYRLFGRDGVTKKEFSDLIGLGIVKKRSDYNENIAAIAAAKDRRREQESALRALEGSGSATSSVASPASRARKRKKQFGKTAAGLAQYSDLAAYDRAIDDPRLEEQLLYVDNT